MTKVHILVGAGLIALSSFGFRLTAQEPQATEQAPAGDVAKGRAIYVRNSCHACHGTVGQGGGPGPILAAIRRPYPSYAKQMRDPAGSMPAYGPRLLNDQDLADIYAYLKSLPGPAKTLPAILKD